jgi:hypothetical protein
MNISTVADDLITPAPDYTTTTASSGMSATWLIVTLIIVVLEIAGLWRVFQKAGRPGWAAIIPIYNIYTLVKIAGRSGWWVLLYLIPIVNIIVSIVIALDIAKAFGKSSAFGIIGLWLFGFIGYPMLGFGDASYKTAQK